ncbi:MAG TPA: hypothetical protein VH012_09090 [Acidimicrobiales bacterium]|jgi:hypothetical protein|nr:hypothetical protein [Acidimicrobiales bacterium]
MVKITQFADDGTETASIEVDDFTIEVIYSGLAEMLQDAATTHAPASAPACGLSRDAHKRRQRVLTRLRD